MPPLPRAGRVSRVASSGPSSVSGGGPFRDGANHLQHEHSVADDVDHRGLAQQAIRHGLAVWVDVAMHQQPRLQRGDHLVQALEAG